MQRLVSLGVFVLLLGGCASYGVVENAAGWLKRYAKLLSASFSGVGRLMRTPWSWRFPVVAPVRRPSLTAGYKSGLIRPLRVDGCSIKFTPCPRCLGGSFTAACYGLHGDAIFEDFEAVFSPSERRRGAVASSP